MNKLAKQKLSQLLIIHRRHICSFGSGWERRWKMDSKELKKILAGVSVVALLGSATLLSGCAHSASA